MYQLSKGTTMKIKVYVSTDKLGSKDERTIEVEDDFDDIDIEETARQTMFEMINWGWEKER